MNTNKKTNGTGRTRNFATVLYADSAPKNWQEILSEHKIPTIISPYHDHDTNPGGELKKPHWHVLIMFDGVKTIDQAKEIFSTINGVGTEIIKSIRGYARYLCHMDNPEKHQYNESEVITLCGADYPGIIGLPIDKYKSIGEMIDYCKSHKIYSYAVLLEYARESEFSWFRILCDCGTLVMKEYLKSKSWEKNSLKPPKYDQ